MSHYKYIAYEVILQHFDLKSYILPHYLVKQLKLNALFYSCADLELCPISLCARHL